MSVAAPEAPPHAPCPRCGAALASDQDWCLHCGTAVTTRVARPPSWRVPAAIVLGVLALAGGGVAIAYAVLNGGDDNRSGAPSTPGAVASASATAAPVPASPQARVPRWPAGVRAYTVVLEADSRRATARARARALAGGGTPAGVLHSDDYAGQRPGFWVVFSGRYRALADARRAAAALQGAAPGAYVRLIRPRKR
jgi:predicted nucleic acid-binding Zn ribbon protein